MKTHRFDILPLRPENDKHLQHKIQKYVTKGCHIIWSGKTYLISSPNKISNDITDTFRDEILLDTITERLLNQDEKLDIHFDYVIEVTFKPGVTDNAAHSVQEAAEIVLKRSLSDGFNISSGKIFFLSGNISEQELKVICEEILGNPLLNQFKIYRADTFYLERYNDLFPPIVQMKRKEVEFINLDQSTTKLKQLGDERCWALSEVEIQQIQTEYKRPQFLKQRKTLGLTDNATDVEMEIIAQSWSEHCKHKIFAANIHYLEQTMQPLHQIGEKRINSLYKSYIKKATFDVKKKYDLSWLVSVFSDNAGIVDFDKNLDLCIKVETHNSPSALDPYGGALTGILGVNRDILGCGIGAKPIGNMDVFCFAHENMLEDGIQLPSPLKHPKRIFEGVHKGVEDGGNKSGIPTINGSIFFDDDYAGKPLVYVGTVGVLPKSTPDYSSSALKDQKPGDLVIVSGGRIGADGIHGATFSSLELNENSPATAVQVGDPFTQKKVMDFLIAARDRGLYSSVTDNGAGGLSSSVGEMAELTGGVEIDLALAPTKYPGLSPYELMISESQERMTFAVPSENKDEFLKLSQKFNVESTVLGEFTNTGFLKVLYNQEVVALLDLKFLHDSLVPMELCAEFNPELSSYHYQNWHKQSTKEPEVELNEAIYNLLSRPNIQSKEKWVRQYDHEVGAATVVKPFTGVHQDGPSDAGVLWLAPHGGDDKNAVAVSNGLQPLYSHRDGYVMAIASMDEAIRNIVATGGNPHKTCVLDNFCWPDPLESINNPDAKHKLAQLVRSCEGLYDSALAYGTPFVSGKDSMKNDFRGKDKNGKEVKISVPPTLLITAMSQIEDVEKIITTDFKQAEDLIYYIGTKQTKLNFSEYTRLYETEHIHDLKIDLERNSQIFHCIYHANQMGFIQSCHDISEGGSITALFESCLGGQLGCELSVNQDHLRAKLFNEPLASFIISVSPDKQKEFEALFKNDDFELWGHTTSNLELVINEQIRININKASDIWKGLQ